MRVKKYINKVLRVLMCPLYNGIYIMGDLSFHFVGKITKAQQGSAVSRTLLTLAQERLLLSVQRICTSVKPIIA